MNRDDFFEGLKSRYLEEFHEAVAESAHDQGREVDYDLLHEKLQQSWRSAQLEGVKEDVFQAWLLDAIPEHANHLQMRLFKKAA